MIKNIYVSGNFFFYLNDCLNDGNLARETYLPNYVSYRLN